MQRPDHGVSRSGYPAGTRIVIAGASGNVGTSLLLHLTGAGHELVGVSRRRPWAVAPYGEVKWSHLDTGAADAVRRLTETFAGADAVVHLA